VPRLTTPLAALLAVGLAGCGGAHVTQRPKAPHLPRALAQQWSAQADRIAAALAEGDGCSARNDAEALRTQVIAAVNARRIPPRLLEPLTSAVNSLPGRIACAPPAAPAPKPKPHGKGHDRPKPPKQHGKHGKRRGG
jgi:hypothetical protein